MNIVFFKYFLFYLIRRQCTRWQSWTLRWWQKWNIVTCNQCTWRWHRWSKCQKGNPNNFNIWTTSNRNIADLESIYVSETILSTVYIYFNLELYINIFVNLIYQSFPWKQNCVSSLLCWKFLKPKTSSHNVTTNGHIVIIVLCACRSVSRHLRLNQENGANKIVCHQFPKIRLCQWKKVRIHTRYLRI